MKPTILIAGDVMLDRYLLGRAERLSPEAPVPILSIDETFDRLGGAANVAANCRALGANVSLFGVVGDDAEAAIISDMLARAGIVTRLSGGVDRTTLKIRMISGDRHLLRADLERRVHEAAATTLLDSLIFELPTADILVLSDYNKGTIGDPARAIAAGRRVGIPVCVDPKQPPFAKYKGAFLLKPNAREFSAATGVETTSDGFAKAATAMRQDLDLEALVITAGARGMYIFTRDGACLHSPAHFSNAVDVTGAGDVVIAALAVELARGASIEGAAAQANLLAARSIESIGTYIVDDVLSIRG